MSSDWSDRVALVTGGAGDIGRALTRLLLVNGARVATADVVAMPKSFSSPRLRHNHRRVDITDPKAVENWLDAVVRDWGVPDFIVSNAALVETGGATQGGDDAWRRTLDVNLTGARTVTAAAARRLLAVGRGGAIVVVGSWAAHAPHPDLAAYSASKAGVRMLMQCQALELAPHGITVNEVAPGFVDAGLSARIWAQDPVLKQRHQAGIPNGRLITPEEVAAVVCRLGTWEWSQVTGATITLDGGLSLLRGPQ